MTEEFTIHKIDLHFPQDRDALAAFLGRHRLALEKGAETAYGIFDSSEHLRGCGCGAGRILKCFAVDEELRGQNALGGLISRLTADRFAAGYYDLFVLTRPKNRQMFVSCGFYPLAETSSVILLENRKNGPEQFYSRCRLVSETGAAAAGCIVMNCNPFTKGHLALITYAAARCSRLHIFVVEEERSAFPFEVRLRLVKEGTLGFPNVSVHPSGPYIISSATFPTYFLKKEEDAAGIQRELDVTLFASRVAPLFHITRRFAGEEPLDPLTGRYNSAMAAILPEYGISFTAIPRIRSLTGKGDCTGEVISASLVRTLLREHGVTKKVLSLVPPCTANYLKNEFRGFTF